MRISIDKTRQSDVLTTNTDVSWERCLSHLFHKTRCGGVGGGCRKRRQSQRVRHSSLLMSVWRRSENRRSSLIWNTQISRGLFWSSIWYQMTFWPKHFRNQMNQEVQLLMFSVDVQNETCFFILNIALVEFTRPFQLRFCHCTGHTSHNCIFLESSNTFQLVFRSTPDRILTNLNPLPQAQTEDWKERIKRKLVLSKIINKQDNFATVIPFQVSPSPQAQI